MPVVAATAPWSGANAPPASHLSPICSQLENLASGPTT
jgi:hypothetical protein